MLRIARKIRRYTNFFFNKYFRNRNIIVVCEGAVKHYPISSTLQISAIAITMGLLSWVSYSTGSYLAAQTIIEEKERRIESATIANRRMEEQFTLLRHDMLKLQEKPGELKPYDRFVLEQHSEIDDKELTHLSRNLLQDRVDYLETIVDELKNEREALVSTIRDRTQEHIAVFEDIIHKTGLNIAKLTKYPKPKLNIKEVQAAEMNPGEAADYTSQGGPYVPEMPMLDEKENLLLQDLDQMVLLGDIVHALPLAKPMKEARITSTFGRRRDPITKGWASHKGMDFVGKRNSKAQATSNGQVIFSGRNAAYGNMIEIDHGYGISTRYAHLKKLLVSEGEIVQKGQPIGIQGNSGRSTGSHLHYEIRFNKTAMNPEKFIKAAQDVF